MTRLPHLSQRRRRSCPHRSGAAFALAVAASLGSGRIACAQEATLLDPVVVTVQRSAEAAFDSPAAISVVNRATIETAGPQVNLSEALRGVPGISVLDRQNYAQDLQLSIRGFGARSTFGIRGVRLIVDGIPATMPDGQAQASNVDLGSVGRIEVLARPDGAALRQRRRRRGPGLYRGRRGPADDDAVGIGRADGGSGAPAPSSAPARPATA